MGSLGALQPSELGSNANITTSGARGSSICPLAT